MRGYAAIGLVGPKIEANVGGAMRAATCYGASLILLEAPRFVHRSTNVTKAQRHIPMIVGDICDHRPHDCPMIAIEIVDGARSLPAFTHPERALYVFGPEDGSIPRRLLDRAQHIISIPTDYCMNLAATVNVVLYDRMAKADRLTTP
jgi:tRNA(Leu) C34 or U34 (ribose-2'-O)-methylase TrmL